VIETPQTAGRPPASPRTILDEAEELIDDYRVAEICGVKRATCIRWREKKVGPPFYRVNRSVRYSDNEVRIWLRTRRVVPRRA
jgi:predicted DNA-binding transcriptional regulator AlpA